MAPEAISTRQSNRANISELGWCIVIMMVLPCSCASFQRCFTITKAVSESKPEVGQSSMITCGSLTNSKAIEVRFFSPPDIPLIWWLPTRVSMHCSSFSALLKSLNTLVFFCWVVSKRRSAANQSVSLTVSVWISMSCCITQLAKSPKLSAVQSTPLALIAPLMLLRGNRQAMALRRVVFPAPDDPKIALTQPPLNIPETHLRISLGQQTDWIRLAQEAYRLRASTVYVSSLNTMSIVLV